MKRMIAFLLAAMMCLSLAACGGTTGKDNGDNPPADEAQTDKTVYTFGDTISVLDGMIEFTPVFEGFAEKLANWPDKDYMTPEGQFSGETPYKAAEDKVMMYFSGTVNYVGESKEKVNFTYEFTVDYDNGYLFEFAGGDAWNRGKGYHSGCGVTDDVKNGDWKYHPYTAFEPLTSNKTRYVRFCIEVPDQLRENSEKVIVTFHIGGEDYAFTMKGAKDDKAEEPKVDYAQILPGELAGVWCDTATDGLLSLYAFKGNAVETFVVNLGAGASSAFAGTYTVGKDRVNYDFGNSTGYSYFTYENNTLTLSNANNKEIKKLSAGDIMAYLTAEESASNRFGVITLSDLILNYYADSAETASAAEKKDAAIQAIKTAGEAALQNIRPEYDKVEHRTWYYHKNHPEYIDICCYIYPYIGKIDNGEAWLRVMLNYTGDQWIFWSKATISVDGNNTYKTFSRSELVRDNDTEVWEYADFAPNGEDIALLKSIAGSAETIIRFEGDTYYYDHVVTANEKTAILDILAAFDYLSNFSE